MELKLYQQKVSNVFGENRILKFCFVVLLLVSIGNWMTLEGVLEKQRVVLVPVNASGDLWVSGEEASDSYLRQMARYITNQIGNYTASTARPQFEELLQLYTSGSYAEAKTGFEKLADEIERYPTVSSRTIWEGGIPLSIDFSETNMLIEVTKERLVNGDVTRREKRTVVIDYRIEDGRFSIESIQDRETDS